MTPAIHTLVTGAAGLLAGFLLAWVSTSAPDPSVERPTSPRPEPKPPEKSRT